MASRNSSPRLRSARGNGMGRGDHIVRASIRAAAGDRMKRAGVASSGRVSSLITSLNPSARG